MIDSDGLLRYDKWMKRIVYASGNKQNFGSPDAGIVGMEFDTHRKYAGPDCKVDYLAWNGDSNSLAENIYRHAESNGGLGSTDVAAVAYSWGCYTAVILCEQLRRRGIDVCTLVLCDPVYRHFYSLGQWRAMVGSSKIRVPNNVANVWWVRQQNPRFSFKRWRNGGLFASPAGHDVVCENELTTVQGPFDLDCEHLYIDNDPMFRMYAEDAIERFMEGLDDAKGLQIPDEA